MHTTSFCICHSRLLSYNSVSTVIARGDNAIRRKHPSAHKIRYNIYNIIQPYYNGSYNEYHVRDACKNAFIALFPFFSSRPQ